MVRLRAAIAIVPDMTTPDERFGLLCDVVDPTPDVLEASKLVAADLLDQARNSLSSRRV